MGFEISFAHTSCKWANLASHNAGVTLIIVGISNHAGKMRRLFVTGKNGAARVKEVKNINAYLVSSANILIEQQFFPQGDLSPMDFGNKAAGGGGLLLTCDEVNTLSLSKDQNNRFILRIYGSKEFINGQERYCPWIEDKNLEETNTVPSSKQRIAGVRTARLNSRDDGAKKMAQRAHQFREMKHAKEQTMVVPRASSENRLYLPVDLAAGGTIIGAPNFALYDAPLWNMTLIAWRLHWVWTATVCVRMRTDFSYPNTLGWNTFPVPMLITRNKDDLTRCAEDILLAREAYWTLT